MNFFKNLKIKARLLFSFSIILIFTAIMGIVGSIQVLKIGDIGEKTFSSNITPLNDLSQFRSYYAEIRRLITLGSLSAKLGNMETFESCKKTALEEIDKFSNLTKDYIDFQNRVNASQERKDAFKKISDSFNNSYAPLAKELMGYYENGSFEQGDEGFSKIVGIGTEITSGIDALFALNFNVASKAADSNLKQAKTISLILVASTIASIIVSLILSLLVGNQTANSIKSLGKVAREVSNGNLNVTAATNEKDEVGQLSRDMAVVVETLNHMISDIKEMGVQLNAGNTKAYKLDETKYEGGFREMIISIKTAISGLINDTNMVVDVIKEFSDGNFNADIAKMPGDKALLNTVVNEMRENLKDINREINSLVKAATEGKLSTRADVSHQKGEWLSILQNLNQLLSAVIEPIYEASNVLDNMSKGNLSVKITGDYKGDFALIKTSMNDTIDFVSSYIKEITEILTELSNNNLNQKVTREYVGDFSAIKTSLNLILDKLNSIFIELNQTSEQVLMGAKQVSETSMTLAQGATEQASSIQELNATIDTIDEQTKRNAQNAKQANELSSISKVSAAGGNEKMKTMLTSMNEISEASNNISKIIKVIDDIAFQTNLLALNAAVEAARAGVHGKGFAVVAEEVRSLAGRSQNAAKETTELIQDSIQKVAAGTSLAQSTASALTEIVENVDKVSTIIEGISNASAEQASAISEVSLGLSQISNVVQQNSSTSEESAAASQELSSQAETLQNMVAGFSLRL